VSTNNPKDTGGTQMVKQRKKNSRKKRNGKGFHKNLTEARKINASSVYETCTEQLSPFGGLLALIKFFDLVNFKEIFNCLSEAHAGAQAGRAFNDGGHFG